MDNVEKFLLEHSEFELPSDELAHHGIKGMQWGVQNGPPYPLSDEKHDNVVEKAAKAVSSAGDSVKKTVRKIENQVAKNKEAKAKAKLEAEKQKLKTAKIKANVEKIKAQKKALKDEEKANKKAEKEKKAAEKQAAKDQKNQKLKDEIMANGDIKACAKHKELFTNEEIAEVVYRNCTLTKLNDLANPEAIKTPEQTVPKELQTKEQKAQTPDKSKKEKLDAAINNVGGYINTAKKVADYAKTGIDTYNTIAKIANATGKANMKVLELEPKKDNVSTKTNKNYDADGNLVSETKSTTTNGNTVTETRAFKPGNQNGTENTPKQETPKQESESGNYSWKQQRNYDDVSSKSTNETINGRPLLTASYYQQPGVEGVGRNSSSNNRSSGGYTSRSNEVFNTTWTETNVTPAAVDLVNSFLTDRALTSSVQYLLEDRKGK